MGYSNYETKLHAYVQSKDRHKHILHVHVCVLNNTGHMLSRPIILYSLLKRFL